MTLQKNMLCHVAFVSRDMGTGERERGSFRGVWTGEVDTWGKHTFQVWEPLDTNTFEPMGNTLYLFRDEFTVTEDE